MVNPRLLHQCSTSQRMRPSFSSTQLVKLIRPREAPEPGRERAALFPRLRGPGALIGQNTATSRPQLSTER